MKTNLEQIKQWEAELRSRPPLEIIRWAVAQAGGRAVVSTNFRPYEAVILHLSTRVMPEIPVLWVDHGYNRPATYRHAEQLKERLALNLKPYLPRISAAHRDAVHGPLPATADEAALRQFSAEMKLEPFRRGMQELSPLVWITALRRTQNPNRAGIGVVHEDTGFGVLKLSPIFDWTDDDMEAYLRRHDLPNEWDYFDPAKADNHRECGLHVNWKTDGALSGTESANRGARKGKDD